MKEVIPFVAQLDASEVTAWLRALSIALPEYTVLLAEDMSEAHRLSSQVAIVANPHPAQLHRLPNLQWVQSLWAGVEKLVLDTQGQDFVIVRMSDPQLSKTMAEAVLAWTLYLHRDMPRYGRQQSLRIWQPHSLKLPSQCTVGILGLGKLGQAAAQTLSAHGFRVCGWSRTRKVLADVETFYQTDGFAAMIRQTHILVCLLPLTHETHHLVGQEAFERMPQNASIINFARGAIVDMDALIQSLNSGHLSQAVLDVFEEEPLPETSPLWSHPNVTVLPHISAPTNKQTASQIVASNINAFFASGTIPTGIDKARGY